MTLEILEEQCKDTNETPEQWFRNTGVTPETLQDVYIQREYTGTLYYIPEYVPYIKIKFLVTQRDGYLDVIERSAKQDWFGVIFVTV
jgi:hypothetical protein